MIRRNLLLSKSGITFGIAVMAMNAVGFAAVQSQAVQQSWPTANGAGQATSPYILASDDQLDIVVDSHDELKASVTILPDGTFSYPQVGRVHAAGLTVQQLQKVLAKGLSETINGPDVTVMVRESRPRRVSVLGAVKTPGLYQATNDSRVLDMVAAAGGLNQDPSLTQATLITNGGQKSVILNMSGLLAGTDADQNVHLNAGDVLLVQARSAGELAVQITGEVAKPGAYRVPAEGESVVSLLAQAGGPTAEAALSHAQIMHDGKTIDINLKQLPTNLGTDTGAKILMPGDVLQIPAISSKIAVLGEVKAPSAYHIPDGGTLSITAALVLAGGTTSEADKRNASLLRKGDSGEPVVTKIDVDALLKGNPSAKDIEMQAGDILYIPSKGQKSGINPLMFIPFLNFIK